MQASLQGNPWSTPFPAGKPLLRRCNQQAPFLRTCPWQCKLPCPCAGAEEGEEDSAAASQAASHSLTVNGQAQVHAGSGSKRHLLRDGEVTDAGFSTMPRKLATIVSGEPVVGTPNADEAQDAQTQNRGN